MPGKVAAIEKLWEALGAGTAVPADLAELRRLAHSIAGSAKTFGLPAVGEAARALEAEILAAAAPGDGAIAARAAQIGARLEDLRRAAAAG